MADTNTEAASNDEIEEMKRRVEKMAEEAALLREMQSQLEETEKVANQDDTDLRSVYVGNVDYSATPEELQAHFEACGAINRITILCDKYTGHPKGFAYIEFADQSSIANAMVLNESLFHGRLIQVASKRTNVPAFKRGRGRGARGNRGGRRGGRFFRGRGRGFTPY